MSDSKKLKIGSIVGGLAFGGFSFCGLNDVDADIVKWTGGVVGVGGQVDFDVDGDQVADIRAYNSDLGTFPRQAFAALNGGEFRTQGTVATSYRQLAGFDTGPGNYLISAGNTNAGPAAFFQASSYVGSNWQGGSVTRNFAFDFTSGGENFFGWGTVEYNGQAQAFEITQGYYEDTAGASITVGQTAAVPEPSSLMLLGLGAAGLAGFRRKRSA